jgi:GntR family transcriptional regulator
MHGELGMPASLTREGPLPLYHQIAGVVRSRITEGVWLPGDQLPAEGALADEYQVSVMTVRQALALLATEGVLRREQGRGTFVAEPSDAAAVVRLTASLEQITAGVAGSRVEPLGLDRVRGPLTVLEALGQERGTEMVRARRVRFAGDTPISYAISYLPLWLGADLDLRSMRRPLLVQLLEEKAGVRFTEAEQVVEATLADAEAANVLQVPAGAPLLYVRRTYRVADGRTAYVALNRYPSGRFRYQIRMVRQGPGFDDWGVEATDSRSRGGSA